MAKYSRPNGVEQDEQEIKDLEQAHQATMPEPEPEAKGPEEETFKKRYGDVRRHLNTITSQKDKEIATLKSQLDLATKKQIKFPKSDAEIDAWSHKYPEVAKIVDTIARKRANEAVELGEKKLESLKNMERQITKERAESELYRMHPDFASIRADKKFHDWVAMQPINIQDSLYKNSNDALTASRAIDLYKADMKITTKRKSNASAAQNVTRSSTPSPTDKSRPKYTESQVDAMSEKEYEKHEEAIMEAMRSGGFVYDVSGAAR